MIDPVVMYDNMMNKFSWGNAEDPAVYLDENNRRMFSNFRRTIRILGKELLVQGDTAKAIEAVHKGLEIVPAEKMPNDFFSIGLAEVLIRAGQKAEGDKLIDEIIEYSKEYLDYASQSVLKNDFGLEYPTGINMQALLDIYNMSMSLKLDSLVAKIEPEINNYYSKLYSAK